MEEKIKRACEHCKYYMLSDYNSPCDECAGELFEPKENKEDLTDNVNHPKHYTQGAIECIDVIEEITKPLDKFEAYLTGTILKYLWRWKLKNGIEDLQKARFYLNRLIEKMEKEDDINE